MLQENLEGIAEVAELGNVFGRVDYPTEENNITTVEEAHEHLIVRPPNFRYSHKEH